MIRNAKPVAVEAIMMGVVHEGPVTGFSVYSRIKYFGDSGTKLYAQDYDVRQNLA